MKPYILKVAFSAFLLICNVVILAQVAAVKFTVYASGISDKDKGVYITGSFNYWHEGDSLIV
jgi:hypothetical protein